MKKLGFMVHATIILSSLYLAAENQRTVAQELTVPTDVFERIDAYLTDAVARAKIQRLCLRLQLADLSTLRDDSSTSASVSSQLPEFCIQPTPPTVNIVDCSSHPSGRYCTCETLGECDCLAEFCPVGRSLPTGKGAAVCESGQLGALAEEHCRNIFEPQ